MTKGIRVSDAGLAPGLSLMVTTFGLADGPDLRKPNVEFIKTDASASLYPLIPASLHQRVKRHMSFYPVYLTRLDQNRVILLGGNDEAERKTGELLFFGAKVHVISKKITNQMRTWADEGALTWTQRDYRYGDLVDTAFVIAADYTPETAADASREAREKNLLINVMDNIPLSNSAFGSLIKQGHLTISFSTNGIAPALAVRLKERFQRELDEAYGTFLLLAEAIREPVMQTIKDPEHRRKLWYQWVDSDTIPLLREGNKNQALDRTEEIWGHKIMVLSGLRPD